MKTLSSLCLLLVLCTACSQDAEMLVPMQEADVAISYDSPEPGILPGSSLAQENSLIRDGQGHNLSHVPTCRWEGWVIETGVTHCTLVIRLDGGKQIEAASLPYPYVELQVGQRVKVGYTPKDNQVSSCDAGELVDVTCLEILDSREVAIKAPGDLKKH